MSAPLTPEEEVCANRGCIRGANCPGHPWRESELGQLDLLEAGSRDMNVAAHRGEGFRQARDFFTAETERLRDELVALLAAADKVISFSGSVRNSEFYAARDRARAALASGHSTGQEG